MTSLVHSNEQCWNEQLYFSLCLTSYLHRLVDTTFYEFIPWDLLKMLLFFKFILDKISGETTFGQLERLPFVAVSYRRFHFFVVTQMCGYQCFVLMWTPLTCFKEDKATFVGIVISRKFLYVRTKGICVMAPSPVEIPIHLHTLLEIFFASPLFLGIVNPFCGGKGECG